MTQGRRTPLDWLAEAIASGAFIGRFPWAPATAGSAAAALIFYFLPFSGRSPQFFLLIAVTTIVGILASHRIRAIGDEDPITR